MIDNRPEHIRRADDEIDDPPDRPDGADLEQDEKEAREARARWRREHIVYDKEGWDYLVVNSDDPY